MQRNAVYGFFTKSTSAGVVELADAPDSKKTIYANWLQATVSANLTVLKGKISFLYIPDIPAYSV
jgi:hypothetical protein